MRSKLLLLAAVMVVGCSDDTATPVAASDATPETIGIDVGPDSGGMPDSATPDSATPDSATPDSATPDSATPDSATPDSATPDSAMPDTEAVDSGVDTALPRDTATPDTADTATPDTADTATPDTADTALDALDTSVTDAAFGTPPTCDGTIGATEYGIPLEGQNQYASGGTTWYMTWDNTSLYLAIANANPGEGAVIYVDANPLTPASGGTNADGNLAGYTYDSTKLATLPFRANLVAYAKSDYREYRTADGMGGWSATPTTAFGCFASSGNNRELSIPWSSLGGRPASFGVLGYVTSGGGFVYGEAPTDNPDGMIGTNAVATKYFHVSSTAPTSTTNAFADKR